MTTPFTDAVAAVIAALPEPSLVTDADQLIVAANPAFTVTTGYSADEVLGRNCRFLQGPGTDPETVRSIRAALANGERFSGKLLNYRRNGEPFWNELSIAPLPDGEEGLSGFISVQRDVTDRVHAQARTRDLLKDLEQQRATLTALLDTARALARETSSGEVLREVAAAMLTLCGADRSSIALWDAAASRLSMVEVAGWEPPLLEKIRSFTLSPKDSPELAQLVALREPVLVNEAASSRWGKAVLEEFEINAFAAVPMESGGSLSGVLVANWATTPGPPRLEPDLHARLSGLAGITATAIQNARLMDQVRWEATHDHLTGLADRDLLETGISAALDDLPAGAGLAVVFCDVDRFKRTNDVYGHATGDRVLSEIASRIRATVREGDLVGRVGGDEFVILLSPVHARSEVDAVLHRLQAALSEPVQADGFALRVRLSTGTAHFRPGSPRPTSTALIQAADADMYRRKGSGGDRHSESFPDLQDLEADLASAVGRGEIIAYYQPQLHLSTGRIAAAEALARWRHPRLGLLQPDQFIALAETSGAIHEIGRHMLRTAARLAVKLRREIPELTMSVNVSTRELSSPTYVDQVRGVLAESGLPPTALTLEITESHISPNQVLLEEQAGALCSSGIRISLDDFGTGYTSIAQLQTLPISELKIDRTFVQQTPGPGADLVAGIIALAHELRLTVVAEGVETDPQLAHLDRVHCDFAQGHSVSRAVPAEELRRLLLARRREPRSPVGRHDED